MLVGRDPELARIAELAADNRATVIFGESGIGKTVLARTAASATGRRVFAGGALATLSWLPYLALERALGRPVPGADAGAVSESVAQAIGDGVLIIDDLQDAHPATVEAVQVLVGRVAVLATVRTRAPDTVRLLARLAAAGFETVELGPLAATDARALARRRNPQLPPPATDDLVTRAGGNPLLVEALAGSAELPRAVQRSLAARLRTLSAEARAVLGLLATAGRPLPRGMLDATSLTELLAAGLCAPDGDATVAVRHALWAETLLADAGAEERRAWHRAVAGLLTDPGERARHEFDAGDIAAAHADAVAAAAAARLPGERAEHLELAARCAPGADADGLRLQAAVALAEAHDWPRMQAVLAGLESPGPLERGLASLLRARGAWAAGESDELARAIADGLAATEGSGHETEVLLRIERCRIPIFVTGDEEEGIATAREAVQLAERTHIGKARASYFLGTALGVADRDGWDEALADAVAAARADGDIDTEFVALINRLTFHESGGSQLVQQRLLDEGIARARELALGGWELALRAMGVALAYHRADYRRVLAEAEYLLTRPVERRSVDMLVEMKGLALVDLGRIEEAEAIARAHQAEAVDDSRGTGALLQVLAEAALWGGRPRQAVRLADQYLAALEGDPLNQPFGRLVRAWACADLGEPPGPAPAVPGRAMLRAVPPELAGVQAMVELRHADAVRCFEQAAELWTGYHRRGELRCRWAAAETARRAGDAEGAVDRLRALEDPLSQAGMTPLLGRVHRSLRAAGVYRGSPRRAEPGSASDRAEGDTLSPRERQVLALVADGLTDQEIGARLGIARRTVQAHVNAAVAKLGARTRRHAAVLGTSSTIGRGADAAAGGDHQRR